MFIFTYLGYHTTYISKYVKFIKVLLTKPVLSINSVLALPKPHSFVSLPLQSSYTTNPGVMNAIHYLIYMIEIDSPYFVGKEHGLPAQFNLSECDYSLVASSFVKHYFSNNSFISAPPRA